MEDCPWNDPEGLPVSGQGNGQNWFDVGMSPAVWAKVSFLAWLKKRETNNKFSNKDGLSVKEAMVSL